MPGVSSMRTWTRTLGTTLTDAEWELVRPLLSPAPSTGRPRRHSLRTILDASSSAVRAGGAWRNRQGSRLQLRGGGGAAAAEVDEEVGHERATEDADRAAKERTEEVREPVYTHLADGNEKIDGGGAPPTPEGP